MKDDKLIFNFSYYESLVFDELINETSIMLDKAI